MKILLRSNSSFLVVLELQDQRLHVLACILPFFDTSLSVGVEFTFLLVFQRLSLGLLELFLLKVLDHLPSLLVRLG